MTNEKIKKNPMYDSIYISKITLNVGSGTNQDKLKKAMNLLKAITGAKPVKTVSKHRILSWGIRPGLPIGAKVTIRGSKTKEVLKALLSGTDNKVKLKSFDNNGNFSFGIKDYIEIDGMKYNPDIGMMGLEASVSLRRKGSRVQLRLRKKSKVGKNHIVSKEDALNYIKQNYNVFVIGIDDNEEEE